MNKRPFRLVTDKFQGVPAAGGGVAHRAGYVYDGKVMLSGDLLARTAVRARR